MSSLFSNLLPPFKKWMLSNQGSVYGKLGAVWHWANEWRRKGYVIAVAFLPLHHSKIAVAWLFSKFPPNTWNRECHVALFTCANKESKMVWKIHLFLQRFLLHFSYIDVFNKLKQIAELINKCIYLFICFLVSW